MLRELLATVADAVRVGDWRGHLLAWWAVVRGEATGDTRAYGIAQSLRHE